MKKGDRVYIKNVGFGITSFEEYTVEKVAKTKIFLEGLNYSFMIDTGQRNLPDDYLGLRISLCVTESDIERAKKYCEEE